MGFPIGAAITVDELEHDPHRALALLRANEPVSWLPALGGWMVTRRATAIAVMRDAKTFTVDDPRFTTGQVVGPSMLSLDGTEHARHADPFVPYYRPAVTREELGPWVYHEACDLVSGLAPHGRAELRSGVAAPLAVSVITRSLGLEGTTTDVVLGWYRGIVESVSALTVGRPAPTEGAAAMAALRGAVNHTIADAPNSMLGSVASLGSLSTAEIVSNTAVLMFGAIETAEGMTSNALYHLLSHPEVLAMVLTDRSLVSACIEESLRLEPAAAVVDRYATRAVELDDASVAAGDLVIVSLAAAGRDPEVFSDPNRFDISRTNIRQHLAFATGPHACIGSHLARHETAAALHAVLDLLPGVALEETGSEPARGLVFRKPPSVVATWTPPRLGAATTRAVTR